MDVTERLEKAIKEYNEGQAIEEGLPLVSDKTRNMAIRFLDFCFACEFRDPHVGVTPEGRVAFQWSSAYSAGLFTVGESGPIYSSAFID